MATEDRTLIFQRGERSDLPVERDRGNTPDRTATTSSSGGRVPPDNIVGRYTYSGADIKLVVHLPPENEEASGRRLTEARQELQEVSNQIQRASGTDETTQAEQRLLELRAQEREALQLLQITPETNPEFEELEGDIRELRQEISDLTELVNTSSRAQTSVEELEERRNQLTREIESLEDEDQNVPSTQTKTLAEIQTLSVTTHREKGPVRPLGTVFPRGVTRGPRTTGGSMVFATFDQHVFTDFLQSASFRSTGVGDWDRYRWRPFTTDQIPPLDISICFANEYGSLSWMGIFGVEFMNEGMVMSIEDLYIETTMQYIARDYDPIRAVGNRPLTRSTGVGQSLTGTNLLVRDLMRRVEGRRNPFL